LNDSSMSKLNHRSDKTNSFLSRRLGVSAFAALAVLLCTGSTAPASCNIGPSNAQVIGAAVGVGAVVAVAIIVPIEVSKSHHQLTGCVLTSANGLELQTSDAKTYSLDGDAASIKVGDRVKIHGSKIKKTKDSTGPQVFKVEMLKKDYGPCPAAAAGSAH